MRDEVLGVWYRPTHPPRLSMWVCFSSDTDRFGWQGPVPAKMRVAGGSGVLSAPSTNAEGHTEYQANSRALDAELELARFDGHTGAPYCSSTRVSQDRPVAG
jgi:hypothetical protein